MVGKVRITLLALLLILVISLVGCMPGDVTETLYTGDIYPNSDNTCDLGSPILRWHSGYFSTLTLGGVTYTSANISGGGGSANVTSFNGRMGAVTSIQADYSTWFVPYIGATDNVDLGTHNLTTTGSITAGNLAISNWNTAYGWGNHATAGYLTWAYAGSTNITTLGTIITGIWHGTPIDDTWIASAATWNAKVGTELDPIFTAIGTAKGDIIAYSANNTPVRVAVGANDKALVADSTAASGVSWADPIPKATDWSGSITWNTASYTTTETDISSLFSTNLTGTTRRKYSVYLDLTNVYSDASFVSLYLAAKTKIDGTNYRAVDRKLILKADIAPTAEPGVAIVIPGVVQDTQLTLQMTVATAGNITIYYSIVEEWLQ